MTSEVNATANLSDVPEISREELRRRLHDPSLTIVDVLPEVSYLEAHIPGALSLRERGGVIAPAAPRKTQFRVRFVGSAHRWFDLAA